MSEENQSEQEKVSIAADYLGFETGRWSAAEILGEKYAQIKASTEFFRVFSEESRMDIVIFLMHSGIENHQLKKYSVSEIAERFAISMSTVSHHLQELKRVGIVKVERSGKERYYQIDLDYIIERVGFLYHRMLAKREMIEQGKCPTTQEKKDIL